MSEPLADTLVLTPEELSALLTFFLSSPTTRAERKDPILQSVRKKALAHLETTH